MGRDKPIFNIALIGHTASGKSTLAGQLVAKLNGRVGGQVITTKQLGALEKDAKSMGKAPAAKYTWLMDTLKSEREAGRSSDIQVAQVATEKLLLTLTDVPGHRNYMKNAITGLSYSDAVLAVVDATPGPYESSTLKDGMLRAHCQLAFTTGVRQMVVAVNKMDAVEGDQQRYEEVKGHLTVLLKKIGFNTDKVAFVPVNAASGDNLTSRAPQGLAWYTGPLLSDALNALELPKRLLEKPLRLPLQDVFKVQGQGLVACGRIEAGSLKPGATLVSVPGGQQLKVKAIQMHGESVSEAFAGDNVGVSFASAPDTLGGRALRRGVVLCGGEPTPAEVSSFQAQVFISHPTEVGPGYCPILDAHTAHVACKFHSLVSKLDRKTGKEVEANPRSLKSGDVAIVELVPTEPLLLESFTDYPALGRFALRDLRQVVGLGVVKSVTRKSTKTAVKAGGA